MDTASFVAALTSLLAIGLTFVLLRLVRQDRQRSEARVAALVSMAGMPASEPAPARVFEHPPLRLERRAAAPALVEPATPKTASHLLYVGVGAVAMVALLTLGFRWSVSPAGPTTETVASVATPAPAVAQPIGLVALRHEQSADGTLVISGVVRNPQDSISREKLFAAASLIDAAGVLVATARAPLDFTTLAPGEESPFVVRVASAGGVARYRIGFRNEQGAPVAHVDRR